MDDQRIRVCRDFLAIPVRDEERKAIIRPVQRGQLTGGSAFIDAIAERLGRRIEQKDQGRPHKQEK